MGEAPAPRFGFKHFGYGVWDYAADEAMAGSFPVHRALGSAREAVPAGSNRFGVVRLIAVNTDDPLAVCTVERFNELLAAEQELKELKQKDGA